MEMGEREAFGVSEAVDDDIYRCVAKLDQFDRLDVRTAVGKRESTKTK
jgi:hypothetical protein